MAQQSDWDEYRLLILDRLDRLDKGVAELREVLGELRQDIAALKVRSGVWGAIAGGIPALVVLVIVYLESRT